MHPRCLNWICSIPSSDRAHFISVPAPGAMETAGSWLLAVGGRLLGWGALFSFAFEAVLFSLQVCFLFYYRSAVIREKELTFLFLWLLLGTFSISCWILSGKFLNTLYYERIKAKKKREREKKQEKSNFFSGLEQSKKSPSDRI